MAYIPAVEKTEKLLVKSGLIGAGKVREMIAYAIEWDCYECRWDIHDGQQHAFVTYRIDSSNMAEMEKSECLIIQRKEALEKLYKYGKKSGMDLDNLIRLELPKNCQHARYV